MRTAAPIRICIAALLLCVAPPVQAQRGDDPFLSVIVRHPVVEARLKAAKARLVWMPVPVEADRACYALQEDHPTHNVTIGQYCLDRRTSAVLEYDVVSDSYRVLR
jgi:hypothetical protein